MVALGFTHKVFSPGGISERLASIMYCHLLQAWISWNHSPQESCVIIFQGVFLAYCFHFWFYHRGGFLFQSGFGG